MERSQQSANQNQLEECLFSRHFAKSYLNRAIPKLGNWPTSLKHLEIHFNVYFLHNQRDEIWIYKNARFQTCHRLYLKYNNIICDGDVLCVYVLLFSSIFFCFLVHFFFQWIYSKKLCFNYTSIRARAPTTHILCFHLASHFSLFCAFWLWKI